MKKIFFSFFAWIRMHLHSSEKLFHDSKILVSDQCCGSGSGIRCFFTPRIRDGATVGSGSGLRDKQTKFVKVLGCHNFFTFQGRDIFRVPRFETD
jgi:hypothetical protein